MPSKLARVETEFVSEELRISLHEMLDLLMEVELNEGSFTDEVRDSIKNSTRAKLLNYKRFLDFSKSQIEECTREIDRLERRKAAMSNAMQRMRNLLAYNMDSFGLKKINAGQCTFYLYPGKMKLDIFDANAVASTYKTQVTTVEIDSSLLREALEKWREGDPAIPGAQLLTGDSYVQIR